MSSLGKTARATEARAAGCRCRCRSEGDLRPDGLAWEPPRRGAPALRERLDDEEASAGLGLRGGVLGARQLFGARVGDLDTEGVTDHVEREVEIAAPNPPVRCRVGRQLRDDVLRRVGRQPPGTQLLGREKPGEAGSAWRGGQPHAEVADGTVEFRLEGDGFRIHITQRGGTRLV